MRQTITIRLTPDLAEWLDATASKSGISQSKIVRDQLEQARKQTASQSFMRMAGTVRGPKGLSRRQGLSRG